MGCEVTWTGGAVRRQEPTASKIHVAGAERDCARARHGQLHAAAAGLAGTRMRWIGRDTETKDVPTGPQLPRVRPDGISDARRRSLPVTRVCAFNAHPHTHTHTYIPCALRTRVLEQPIIDTTTSHSTLHTSLWHPSRAFERRLLVHTTHNIDTDTKFIT